jgi:hypothetical protein
LYVFCTVGVSKKNTPQIKQTMTTRRQAPTQHPRIDDSIGPLSGDSAFGPFDSESPRAISSNRSDGHGSSLGIQMPLLGTSGAALGTPSTDTGDSWPGLSKQPPLHHRRLRLDHDPYAVNNTPSTGARSSLVSSSDTDSTACCDFVKTSSAYVVPLCWFIWCVLMLIATVTFAYAAVEIQQSLQSHGSRVDELLVDTTKITHMMNTQLPSLMALVRGSINDTDGVLSAIVIATQQWIPDISVILETASSLTPSDMDKLKDHFFNILQTLERAGLNNTIIHATELMEVAVHAAHAWQRNGGFRYMLGFSEAPTSKSTTPTTAYVETPSAYDEQHDQFQQFHQQQQQQQQQQQPMVATSRDSVHSNGRYGSTSRNMDKRPFRKN